MVMGLVAYHSGRNQIVLAYSILIKALLVMRIGRERGLCRLLSLWYSYGANYSFLGKNWESHAPIKASLRHRNVEMVNVSR